MKEYPPYPVFPILVIDPDGTETFYNTPDEAAMDLEWVDSEDLKDGPIKVFDFYGRPVRLKIEALEIVICELKEREENSK